MRPCLRVLVLFVFLGSYTMILGQEVTTSLEVHGKVRDVTGDYFLSTATVSLFDADSSLVNFQITDTYGVFRFKAERVAQPAYIVVSNVGYKANTINLSMTTNGGIIDLGIVDMHEQITELDVVEIQISPVTLNGDTLEFNPAAFKLDSNAVLDDLLKKIPNVTVWNDGQITVNGREVKSLVVNGKLFFGTDFKVATRNLPSDIIQKVQVYRKEPSRINPLDSTLEMNIKLKKGMENGGFGKFSIGGGTGHRYEAEGNINIFSRKMQLSLAGTVNNTNKISNNMETLLNNSAFKSDISDLSYQSNFRIPGQNDAKIGGATFKYDFLNTPEPTSKNELTATYFHQDFKRSVESRSVGIRTLNATEQNVEHDATERERYERNDDLSVRYERQRPTNNYSLGVVRSIRKAEYSDKLSTEVRNSRNDLLSTNNGRLSEDFISESYQIDARYSFTPYAAQTHLIRTKRYLPFDAYYSANISNGTSNSTTLTSFDSQVDSEANIDFNRNRTWNHKSFDQNIEINLNDIDQVLLGQGRNFMNIAVFAKLNAEQGNKNEEVYDGANEGAQINSYLTNRSESERQRIQYGLAFSRNISKRLSNRFEKNLNLNFRPGIINSFYRNESENERQNLKRQYMVFSTDAGLNLYSHVFGKWSNNSALSYTTVVNFPTVEQLAPLVDSTQVYHLFFGNSELKPETIQRFHLSHSKQFLKSPNSFSYNVEGGFEFSSDKIIDSVMISSDNRQQRFLSNSGQYRSYNAGLEVRKAVKFKSSDLKAHVYGSAMHEEIPASINDNFVINKQLSGNVGTSLGYGYKDLLTFELRENIVFYRSEQPLFNSKINGTTFTHSLNASYRFPNALTVNSNLNVNVNRSGGKPATAYTIWNVYVSQRFLKHDNAEIKVSALDVLRQNTNIINRIGVNNFVTTTRNSLQQYFLLSISYYPRIFGK